MYGNDYIQERNKNMTDVGQRRFTKALLIEKSSGMFHDR